MRWPKPGGPSIRRGKGLTCAREVDLVVKGPRSQQRLHTQKLPQLRTRDSRAHAATHLRTQACCCIGMAPSSSKFYPRLAHKRYAPLEWPLPPLTFTLRWLTLGSLTEDVLCWNGPFLLELLSWQRFVNLADLPHSSFCEMVKVWWPRIKQPSKKEGAKSSKSEERKRIHKEAMNSKEKQHKHRKAGKARKAEKQ